MSRLAAVRQTFRWAGLAAALALAAGCAASQSSAPSATAWHYVTPPTTYLRTCPSFGEECPVVVQVYAGDRVEVLDRNDYGWGRVRLERGGVIGWAPLELLSLTPTPAIFYVATVTEALRECGDYQCKSLEQLKRGDQVEKLDQDDRGWWRVRSRNSGKIGWIPVMAVSARPGPPIYYVNVSSLALRAGPAAGARNLGNLPFNAQVEVLGTSPGGWAKVRDLSRGLIGWCAVSYLEAAPLTAPRPAPRKPKPPARKPEPKPDVKPGPDVAPPEKPMPRVM